MNCEFDTANYEINNVKNIYNIIANEFNVTRTYHWSWIKEYIYSNKKNALIYDIGCGNGRNMKHDDYQFIGVDNCEKFVEMCNKQNMKTLYGEMTNIPLESNTANMVMCIASFHHLANNDNRMKALLEMKRLIKDDGKILISVWSIEQPAKTRVTFDKYGDNIVYWKNKYPRYYYIFDLNEIMNLFKKAELVLIEHKYDCGNEIFLLKKSI